MVVIGQKLLYSCKLVLSGQNWFNWANWLFLGKIGCIRAKWLLLGNLVVFGQNWLYSGILVVFG